MTSVTMDCHSVLANISGYLDRELERTECESIDLHCRQCASCAALVQGLRETIGLCRAAASTPLPETVRQRAKESVRRLLRHPAVRVCL
jgi:anti-sigma factor RsiW